MGSTLQQDRAVPTDAQAPRAVRRAVWAGVGALLAGALYLIAVRGEVLFAELAAIGARVWCF